MPRDERSDAHAAPEQRTGGLTARHPSPLSVARLSKRPVFPPGGPDLYRHIARLVELGPEHEFVVAPCGMGTTAQFLAETSGAAGAGVDPDAELAAAAEARAREAGLGERLHYEHASLEDLPYKDAVFDVAIGEIEVSATEDPETAATAVGELARITKPMGTVVLIQPVWTRSVEPERRRVLVEQLGVRPVLAVEWKQMLRDAGVVDLYIEDWSEAAAALGRPVSWRDKLGVLYRIAQSWGWRGVKEMLLREKEIRRMVTEERVLGLSLIKGVKWPEHHPEEDTDG